MNKITKAMGNDVFGRLLDERVRRDVSAKKHAVDVTSEFKPIFDSAWRSAEYRLNVCPPKQVIAKLNEKLQGNGYKAVSMIALARAHGPSEIPQEVKDLLTGTEASVSTQH